MKLIESIVRVLFPDTVKAIEDKAVVSHMHGENNYPEDDDLEQDEYYSAYEIEQDEYYSAYEIPPCERCGAAAEGSYYEVHFCSDRIQQQEEEKDNFDDTTDTQNCKYCGKAPAAMHRGHIMCIDCITTQEKNLAALQVLKKKSFNW